MFSFPFLSPLTGSKKGNVKSVLMFSTLTV